ncbi:MAG: hypothetical protein JOZ58_00280 [Acetobacteraceae bacterium]|nr:hypothetical protein [Acetobacteraceae bacterium]
MILTPVLNLLPKTMHRNPLGARRQMRRLYPVSHCFYALPPLKLMLADLATPHVRVAPDFS